MSQLYSKFECMFLEGDAQICSPCGHEVLFFDHHFFHMAGVVAGNSPRLYMVDEKEEIRRTTAGFGKYTLEHKGSRARNLPSARATLLAPDEVWENNPIATTAQWVYIKEFNSKPYPFTVTLLVARPAEGGIIVPVSSFPCKRNDIRKWRQGTRVYAKQHQPPEGG